MNSTLPATAPRVACAFGGANHAIVTPAGHLYLSHFRGPVDLATDESVLVGDILTLTGSGIMWDRVVVTPGSYAEVEDLLGAFNAEYARLRAASLPTLDDAALAAA